MSVEILIGIILVALLVFLFVGIPVAFTLFGLSMMIALATMGPQGLYIGYVSLISVVTKEIYISVPLFIFMAGVLEFSGIVSNLYDMMYKWAGRLRGGLAIGTIGISCFIDAISGLGGTAVVTLGILALPEMLKRGYHKNIALGCLPAGGALGPVIPPSVIMIILGGMTGLSVGKLFIGGILPGLLIASLWSLYITIACAFKPSLAPALPPEARATWWEKIKSLRYVIAPVFLISLVMGSIYTGLATPTEAAGVGAIGALICTAINRKFSWENMKKAMQMTATVSAMVYFLMIGGTAFASIMATTGISATIRDTMLSITPNPLVLVIMTQIVTLILGCLMDAASNLMICTPVFWPMIIAVPEIDPFWWIIVFTLTLCLGYITPPFGMNLFYLKGLAPKEITMGDIFRAATPFSLVYIIGIILCIAFPIIITYFPNLMMK